MSSTTDSMPRCSTSRLLRSSVSPLDSDSGSSSASDPLRAERMGAERRGHARVDAAGDGDDRAALAQPPEDELRKGGGDLVERCPAVEPERVERERAVSRRHSSRRRRRACAAT